jgi:heat shock protein HtpX
MYEAIERNRRLVKLIVVGTVVGVALIVALPFYLTHHLGYLLAALIFSFGWSFFTYFYGEQLVIKSLNAKPIPPRHHPHLEKVVEEMSLASGLPMPPLYQIDRGGLNAMAVGKRPNDAVLIVTLGLVSELSEGELRGVIAHEMAHIKNLDTLYATLLASMVGGATLFFRLLYARLGTIGSVILAACYLGLLGFLGLIKLAGVAETLPYLIFLVLLPVILALLDRGGKLVQAIYSQQREYLADAQSIQFTRDPDGIINALNKLKLNTNVVPSVTPATTHFFFVSPIYAPFQLTIFDTHPPLEERLKKLRAIARTPPP